MKDFQLTKHNLNRLFEELQKELSETPVIIITSQAAGTGKWGMARLWRSWMQTTADFMCDNGVTMPLMYRADGKPYGRRPFNAADAHELFTRQHLGVDEKGNRLSWAKSDQNCMRKATKGERYNAMLRHQIWASERGIALFNPVDSEYRKLESEQNK